METITLLEGNTPILELNSFVAPDQHGWALKSHTFFDFERGFEEMLTTGMNRRVAHAVRPVEHEIILQTWWQFDPSTNQPPSRHYNKIAGALLSFFRPNTRYELATTPPLNISLSIGGATWRLNDVRIVSVEHVGNVEDQRGEARIRLVASFPFWERTFSGVPVSSAVVSTNNIAAINMNTGAVVGYPALPSFYTISHLAYSAADGYVWAGSSTGPNIYRFYTNGTFNNPFNVYFGNPCGGLGRIGNALLFATSANITNPLYYYDIPSNTFHTPATGINAGVNRIRVIPNRDGDWAVVGRFTAPRKGLIIYNGLNFTPLGYRDIYQDASITSVDIRDVYYERMMVVAVGAVNNSVSEVRWGGLQNYTNPAGDTIDSVTLASTRQFTSIAHGDLGLHELHIGGTANTLPQQIGCTYLLRGLGGREITNAWVWLQPNTPQQFNVERVGSRVFGFLTNASPSYLFMWSGGGWIPIVRTNGSINAVAGDDTWVWIAGQFTQVLRWSEIQYTQHMLDHAVATVLSFPTGTNVRGLIWTDGRGGIHINAPLNGLNLALFRPDYWEASDTANASINVANGRVPTTGLRQMILMDNPPSTATVTIYSEVPCV